VGGSGSYLANASAQAIGRILAVGANLISLLLVARLLGIEEFGRYAYVMAYVSIACSLADLGTTSVLGRGLVETPEHARAQYFANFWVVRVAITVVATLLAIGASPFVKPDLGQLLLIGSLAVPFVASRFFDPLFQVCGRPRYTVVTNLVYAVSLIVTSVAILAWARMSLFAYLISWAACNFLYTITATVLAVRLIRPRFELDREGLRSIVTLAAPLGVGALFYMLHTRADTLILSYLRPIHEVGLYSAAFRLLDLGTVAATTLLWPLVPILSQTFRESAASGREAARRVVETVGVFSLPIGMTASYVAEPVILLLYGPGFGDAAPLIGVFAAVFVVLAFCLAGAVINISVGRVNYDYWNTALAVAVNVSLNLVLIPRFGFAGAAYATLVSHLCMLAVVHYYANRNVGSIFVRSFWVRVVGINLALLAGLAMFNAREHLFVVIAGVLIYALIVWRMRLLPTGISPPDRTRRERTVQGAPGR
jgi:O-antigen/teichoic acid export membrane protein